MVEVVDSALQQAAGEGMDAFIQVFTDAYEELTGGCLLYTSPSPRDCS